MNKEFLVVLLEKDIRELALLTEGFEDMNTFPAPILRLAREKAEGIIENLDKLGRFSVSNAHPLIEKTDSQIDKSEYLPQTPVVSSLPTEEMKIEEVFEVSVKEDVEEDEPADFVEELSDYKLPENLTVESTEKEKEPETITATLPAEKSEDPLIKTMETPVAEEEKEEIKEDFLSLTPQIESVEVSAVAPNTFAAEAATASNSLNENIKVDDIRTAINIGDRFRFQRELFNGNGEVMNKTLAYLNQLAKYDEALSFLDNKFGWEKDNAHAEDFLQLVRRRYL